VLSLTWAAAVTKRVRLGTSVLVLPMRHPQHHSAVLAENRSSPGVYRLFHASLHST